MTSCSDSLSRFLVTLAMGKRFIAQSMIFNLSLCRLCIFWINTDGSYLVSILKLGESVLSVVDVVDLFAVLRR